MEFAFSDDQRHWQEAAIAFARSELTEGPSGRDERGEFWHEGWRLCARFGLLGLPVPEAYGGRGRTLAETAAALEGLGYACEDNGLIVALNAALWTVILPLVRYGTEAQKARYLPGLCGGAVVAANAASEPEAGSDIFALATRARRVEGGWVLDGRKTWCTAAPVADLFVLYASTDPVRGALGLSAFLVDRATPGLELVRTIAKMGLRTAPMGELSLAGCTLPADALLGREGRGADLFQASMGWERGLILAAALGTMRRQVEACVAFARRRRQFGQPIGKFQAVSHRIADMAVRLETCRPLVHRVAWLLDRGQDATTAAAMAKLHVSECLVQNGLDAVRTFGALGYESGSGPERDLRDGVGSLIYSGTNDVQRSIIAKGLGL